MAAITVVVIMEAGLAVADSRLVSETDTAESTIAISDITEVVSIRVDLVIAIMHGQFILTRPMRDLFTGGIMEADFPSPVVGVGGMVAAA